MYRSSSSTSLPTHLEESHPASHPAASPKRGGIPHSQRLKGSGRLIESKFTHFPNALAPMYRNDEGQNAQADARYPGVQTH